jgi:hypothetical protein
VLFVLQRPFVPARSSVVRPRDGARVHVALTALDDEACIGGAVRDFRVPGDTLCVAARFEPVFYVVSGLKCPSRFPIQQGFGFRDGAWAREHDEALHADPPTFVVGDRRQPDLAAFLRRGYGIEWEGPRFVVLRRP